MKFKEFFKLTVGKIIIFFGILLMFLFIPITTRSVGCGNNFSAGCDLIGVKESIFEFMVNSMGIFVSIVISLLISYLISCLIIYISNKIKIRKKHRRN